jgi:hypothetical protein
MSFEHNVDKLDINILTPIINKNINIQNNAIIPFKNCILLIIPNLIAKYIIKQKTKNNTIAPNNTGFIMLVILVFLSNNLKVL